MLRCRRCQRMNPAGAAYCYHDGTSLDAGAPGGEQFSRDWTFPGKPPCRTVDELARACLADWTEAKNALIRRDFQRFFREAGREDLAAIVPAPEPDADLALQAFLERLPSKVAVKPAIDVAPRRLHFADLRKGAPRTVVLRVINRGAGWLSGRLSVMESVRWISVAGAKLSTRSEQAVELTIDPAALPGAGSFFARLKIESNGGNLEVPVQADFSLAGIPFKEFAVSDPYDMAKVMLAHPKRAARWMADGEVRQFFDRQGWVFPVEGPLAPSLGSLQQFFEALRLSSIPEVTPETTVVECTAAFPERITRSITLTTPKKWIHATAESDEFWLKPVEPIVAGSRTVEVPFEVDSALLRAGRTYEGILRIRVNGGVEHSVLVRADIRRPFEPWTRKILRPFTG